MTKAILDAIIKPERRDRENYKTKKKGAVSGEEFRTVAGSRFAEIRLPLKRFSARQKPKKGLVL